MARKVAKKGGNTMLYKLALKGFMQGKPMPKSAKQRARCAAKFVEYLGTMNQPDRDFHAFDEYATDGWEAHESTQHGTDWKKDERDEVGFGVPRSAAKRVKALEASKLAYLFLGPKTSDDVLRDQAQDFMSMTAQSIKSTTKRAMKMLSGNDETGQEDNSEFDEVDDDEDSVDQLEDVTDVGDTDDSDEVDDIVDASEEKTARRIKRNKASGKKKKSDSDQADNKKKEKAAKKKKRADVEEDDEDDINNIAQMLKDADEDEDIDYEEDDDMDVEADEEYEDDSEIDDVEEASEDSEDEDKEMSLLAKLYSKKKNSKSAKKKTAKSKKRTASVSNLGRVTRDSSSEGATSEVASLEKMWGKTPRINWTKVDDGLFQ